jgi:hypothetical protein
MCVYVCVLVYCLLDADCLSLSGFHRNCREAIPISSQGARFWHILISPISSSRTVHGLKRCGCLLGCLCASLAHPQHHITPKCSNSSGIITLCVCVGVGVCFCVVCVVMCCVCVSECVCGVCVGVCVCVCVCECVCMCVCLCVYVCLCVSECECECESQCQCQCECECECECMCECESQCGGFFGGCVCRLVMHFMIDVGCLSLTGFHRNRREATPISCQGARFWHTPTSN